jgi:peptidoglycan hydrolase CwlO-like protein
MPANNLDNKIMHLKNFIENMQKELTKLWLTQKEYDKKLIELRDDIDILKQNLDYLSKDVYGNEQA